MKGNIRLKDTRAEIAHRFNPSTGRSLLDTDPGLCVSILVGAIEEAANAIVRELRKVP